MELLSRHKSVSNSRVERNGIDMHSVKGAQYVMSR